MFADWTTNKLLLKKLFTKLLTQEALSLFLCRHPSESVKNHFRNLL